MRGSVPRRAPTGPDRRIAPQRPSPPPTRRPNRTALAFAGIVLAGLAAYSDSFRCPFIFDDKVFVDQPTAQNLWPVWPLLTAPRPVAQFTLALNHSLGGDLWGYHAFNLAVHLLAALTLFGIVRRTLTLPLLAPRFGRAATALAFCIASLWTLHPLQTEAVTYIIQRMESLMGLFYLLTLYCFIRAVSWPDLDGLDHQGTRTPRTATDSSLLGVLVPWWSRRWYMAAVLASALGMGSKEVMVTAPVLVLLYDRTFIAGSFREALRRRWGFYLALAATWLIVARQVTWAFAPQATSAGFSLPDITPFQYARSELGVILHYLRLAFWPSGLCLDYDWPVARTAGDILPGAIVVGGLLAATVWALVRQPAWGFIGAWFFLTLAPTSSILPVEDLAFEHRMYLPLTAVVAAAVLAACTMTRARAGRGLALVLALTLVPALGCLTFRRNHDYRTAVSIWQDTSEKRPEDARAWNNLGKACSEAGFHEEAIRCFDKAIALRPDEADWYYNRGGALSKVKDFAKAIGDYDKAIALKGDSADAYYNRGWARAHAGDLARAIQDYNKAISLDPGYAAAYNNRGAAYDRLGLHDKAVVDYTLAIKLKPDNPGPYANRAMAFYKLEEYGKAWVDVLMSERLGGQPNPAFLIALQQAAPRPK